MPAASAKPPPNIMITPQGALSASCQVSNGRPVPSGIRNNSNDPAIAMLPSVIPPLGKSGSSKGCPIHIPITKRKIGTSRFSATDMGRGLPMATRAASTSKLPAVTFCTRIRMNAHNGTPIITTGRPQSIHVRKLISMPNCFSTSAAAIALVGDPTSVPSPPIDAAKATPMISAPASPSVSPGLVPPAASTAIAIGTMMSAIDVLDITMLSNAVEPMNAIMRPVTLCPDFANMARATRRCMPVRSMVSARNAPPRMRNRIGE